MVECVAEEGIKFGKTEIVFDDFINQMIADD